MAFSKSICFLVIIAAISIVSLSAVDTGKGNTAQEETQLVDSYIDDKDITVPPPHQVTDEVTNLANQPVVNCGKCITSGSCSKRGPAVKCGKCGTSENENDLPTITRPLTFQSFETYLSGYVGNKKKIVLLMDYDGTLTSIVDLPENAKLPDETKDILERLSKMPNVYIAIISGRGLGDVQKMVGIKRLTYAGNTGLDILFRDGGTYRAILTPQMEMQHKELVEKLRDQVCEHGAWVEDKQITLTYHYRKVPEELLPPLVATARELISAVEFKAGNAPCAIEVTPPIDWDKGHAALHILKEAFGENWKNNAIIYVGDDVNDEYAMKALQNTAITFRVDKTNKVETSAHHRLPNPEAVFAMLQWVERHFKKCN